MFGFKLHKQKKDVVISSMNDSDMQNCGCWYIKRWEYGVLVFHQSATCQKHTEELLRSTYD